MSTTENNKKIALQMIGLFIAVQLLAAVAPLLLPESLGTLAFILPSVLLFTLGAAGMIMLQKKNGMVFEFETPFKQQRLRVLSWGLLGMVLAIVVQTLASIIEFNFLGSTLESQNTQMIVEVVRSYPIFLLVAGVAGPVMEEFVFRKALFGLMVSKIGGVGAAVISSLLFAFIHMDGLFLVYSSMGLVFAWLYMHTKNIWTPVIAHCLMNIFAVLANIYLL
ncbi:CAAX amino terminal protease family protein [Alkalibacterium sp. AK22]|uniref:CPBP family intramembrane glutamic endopeptidase n=1 Tax=Alkalibacterium sp. AK22 TaxID=1229520 RepID=UPI000449642F|nr:type II CAAX endopeptidase family protein [Alkalibacterium sp. AK22]EXJ23598.1 CAAX amino terminal protease family protein [Alkalibacterium sp. AK22]